MQTIYELGREAFPKWWIVMENLLFLLNWGIAFTLLLPFKYYGLPLVSWLYLVIIIFLQVLLKKHNCTNCYYYGKWCHLGWGKLTKLFYQQYAGNQRFGMRLAISYIVNLPVIVILAIFAGILYGFDVVQVVLLLGFIAINLLQGFVLRKQSCIRCKARLVCPGCAVANNRSE